MTRIGYSFLALVVVGVGLLSYVSLRAEQPAPLEQGQLLPGCTIPRSFGRLVSVMPGNNSGLAGQAVFEAEDGVIRWVPLMFNSQQSIMQKPAQRPMPANFPILPLYECAVGHVWQRQ